MNTNELQAAIDLAESKEKSGDFFSAAIFYKEALELALKQQNSKAIKLCKKKIVETNKKSLTSGAFQEVEFTHEFSEDQQKILEKIILSVVNKDDIKKSLFIIGTHPFFYPKINEVEAQSKKDMPISHIMATLTTVADTGHIVSGGSLGEYSWFMQMYSLHQGMIMDMYLDRIFWHLMNSKTSKNKLTFKKLEKYFQSKGIINPEQMNIITIGLKQYFKEDYISTLHILIPQFEALLLSIAQRCGIDIFAIDKKRDLATRTAILSEYHLDSEEFKKTFGEDFCRQVKFILFEPLGYKLRHKVAHGEITLKECNFRNANLIIYLYLVLLSRVEVKNKNSQTTDI
jgi:hypothetical protein